MIKKTRNVLLGLILIVLMVAGAKETAPVKPTDRNLASASVMITNMSRNSGGSGSILVSTPASSKVLTNGHVCQVVVNGGYVVTDDGQTHLVTSYRTSNLHDLCLLEVSEDLHVNTSIALHSPLRYDPATIVGHPKLYPTVITKGHFSGKQVVSVHIGTRACTKEEIDSPETGLFCAIAGGVPVIKTYESILVTATIMPGSSGSPIYNEAGEVSAVVFAGAGDLGYAHAVPFEYVATFLMYELPFTELRKPNLESYSGRRDPSSYKDKFAKACDKAYTSYQHKVCKIVLDSI